MVGVLYFLLLPHPSSKVKGTLDERRLGRRYFQASLIVENRTGCVGTSCGGASPGARCRLRRSEQRTPRSKHRESVSKNSLFFFFSFLATPSSGAGPRRKQLKMLLWFCIFLASVARGLVPLVPLRRGPPLPKPLQAVVLKPSSNALPVAISPQRKILKTTLVLLGPAMVAGLVASVGFGPLARWLRGLVGLGALDILANDSGQYLQNFLGVIGILLSLLIGNTYSFCYNQQVMIFMAYFEEISVAKSLLEQATLVCRGRPYYDRVLDAIQRYIDRDLKRTDLPPAVVLSSKPKDDPLEQIMWMTSVGTPSIIYDTVKWLRQARGARLGAVQRKLPPLHFVLLFGLSFFELSAFPLLSAGAAATVGDDILKVEAAVFGLLAAAIVLTLAVLLQLWRPTGSIYSVDDALATMIDGLQDELNERRLQISQGNTNLPEPPSFYPS